MTSIPIERFSHTTDDTAPWDGVRFIYDVGSDELDEALRACVPEYRTLRQRKHAAIIKFLEQELLQMPNSKATQSSAQAKSIQSLPRVDLVCGDVLVKAKKPAPSQNTLSITHSPATSNGSLAYQEKIERYTAPSTPASQPLYIDPTAATHSSQFVFNAFDGRTMQPKTKRRMTFEERMEYKETRKRGACPDCKQKKGKCTHMDGINNSTSSHSITNEQPKRRLSCSPGTPKTKLSKGFQPTLDQNRHDSVVQQQYDLQQPQSADTSRRSSNASRESPSGSASSRRGSTVNEQPHSGMSGYVQPSHLSAQNSNFINDDQVPGWTDHHMDNQDYSHELDYPHDFNSFQFGPASQYSQDRPDNPEYPSIRVYEAGQDDYIPLDYEQLDYSSSNGWGFGQQPHPDAPGFT